VGHEEQGDKVSKTIEGVFDELPEEKPEKTGKAGARLFYPVNWMEPPVVPGGTPTMRILGGATVRQAYKMAALQGLGHHLEGVFMASKEMEDCDLLVSNLGNLCARLADVMIDEDEAHEKEIKNGK